MKRGKSGHHQAPFDLSQVIDAGMLDALGLDDVIPAPLAAWRPLVVEGLAFLLGRLPPERLNGIVQEQFALPPHAPAAARLVVLLASCPTLHKLGQVLARHRDLNPELREHLQVLESMPSSLEMAPIAARIEAEFGSDAGLSLADAPLAEGSVAVVVPFSWREEGSLQDGVLKVLKPGIEERLADELAALPDLAAFLDRRARELDLPALDFRGTLASVRELLTREVHLEVEQANLRRAWTFYRDDESVCIPRLLPWCTPRVTAMERVVGPKVTDAALSARERRVLGERMLSALLAKPFWSRADEVMFHGDLHGGNLMLAEDGRLAVLDWSMTAVLSKAQREALVVVALGGLTLDAQQICGALAGLGTLGPDDPVLVAVVDESLNRLVASARPAGFGWVLSLFDALSLRGVGGFGEELPVLRKTWLSLSGVIGDLGADLAPDISLLGAGLRRFVAELPARMVAAPASRAFSTHVSNADLARLSAAPWSTTLRYWSRFMGNAFGAAAHISMKPPDIDEPEHGTAG